MNKIETLFLEKKYLTNTTTLQHYNTMGRKTEDGHRVRGKDKAMNTFNKYGKFSAKHSRTMEAASENKKNNDKDRKPRKKNHSKNHKKHKTN